MPSGIAEPADGGHVLNGRWPFSSAADHCEWDRVAGTGLLVHDDPYVRYAAGVAGAEIAASRVQLIDGISRLFDKVAAGQRVTVEDGRSTRAGIPCVTTIGSAAAELAAPGAFSLAGGFFSALAAMAKYCAQQGCKQVTAYVIEAPAAVLGAKSVGAPVFRAARAGFSVSPVTAGVAGATAQVVSGLAGKPGAVALVADAGTCEPMLKALKARYYPSAGTGGYTVTGYQSMLGLARAAAGLSGAVTPASVTAALKAARDVPLPAGDGLTFTCDGKQIPGLLSACSPDLVVLTITNGQGLDPQLIG
jgi:branched-chain amino acid transport system substrate-binding protein